jgi:hypothetical protein
VATIAEALPLWVEFFSFAELTVVIFVGFTFNYRYAEEQRQQTAGRHW